MNSYWDTSAILALNIPGDALHLAAARCWDELADLPRVWCWVHDLEILQTVRNLAQRHPPKGSIDHWRCLIQTLEEDVANGIFLAASISLEDTFQTARLLSAEYGWANRVGAVDLLHVAAAQKSGCAVFVTGDRQQAGLTQDAGLKTLLLD